MCISITTSFIFELNQVSATNNLLHSGWKVPPIWTHAAQGGGAILTLLDVVRVDPDRPIRAGAGGLAGGGATVVGEHPCNKPGLHKCLNLRQASLR